MLVVCRVLCLWNWTYISFLIFLSSQANLLAPLGANPQSVTGPSTVLSPAPSIPLLSFPFLISSSFLFAVDFYPSTRLPALLKLNKYFFQYFLTDVPKGASLCRKEWSPQFISIKKFRSCTASEQIIEMRAWGESQGSPSMTFIFLIT